jgi:hypothetical protein
MDLRDAMVAVSHHFPTNTCTNDPDLAAVIDAWDGLPAAVKAGILAMLKASATH